MIVSVVVETAYNWVPLVLVFWAIRHERCRRRSGIRKSLCEFLSEPPPPYDPLKRTELLEVPAAGVVTLQHRAADAGRWLYRDPHRVYIVGAGLIALAIIVRFKAKVWLGP